LTAQRSSVSATDGRQARGALQSSAGTADGRRRKRTAGAGPSIFTGGARRRGLSARYEITYPIAGNRSLMVAALKAYRSRDHKGAVGAAISERSLNSRSQDFACANRPSGPRGNPRASDLQQLWDDPPTDEDGEPWRLRAVPPHSGHVSNFRGPVGPMIQPMLSHCFESDPRKLLAHVH